MAASNYFHYLSWLLPWLIPPNMGLEVGLPDLGTKNTGGPAKQLIIF